MARQTESGKKPKKKKEKWMGFYNGRIPKKLITKKARKPTKKPVSEELPQLEPKDGTFAAMAEDNEEDGFQPLTPWEIERHGRRQKDKNLWLFLFGVIIIAIILSLVERSRIFSVIAVVALIAVFLLYRYEVKI